MLRMEAKSLIRKNLSGTPEWIRTTDLLLRRQTLYPAELRARVFKSYEAYRQIHSFCLLRLKVTLLNQFITER